MTVLRMSLLLIVLLIILVPYIISADEKEIIETIKKRLLTLDQYIIKEAHSDCNLSKFVKITEIPYGRRY